MNHSTRVDERKTCEIIIVIKMKASTVVCGGGGRGDLLCDPGSDTRKARGSWRKVRNNRWEKKRGKVAYDRKRARNASRKYDSEEVRQQERTRR